MVLYPYGWKVSYHATSLALCNIAIKNQSCDKFSGEKWLEVIQTFNSFLGFSPDSGINPIYCAHPGAYTILPILKEVQRS